MDAVNVYVPFANVNNYLFDCFGEFEFKHTATVLLDTLTRLPNGGTGCIGYLHLAENQMDLAVFEGKKLRFFNSFPHNASADAVYYLLFTLEQLQIDPAEIRLRLLGEIREDGDLYDLVGDFVENISVFAPESGAMDTIPADEGIDFTLINAL